MIFEVLQTNYLFFFALFCEKSSMMKLEGFDSTQ